MLTEAGAKFFQRYLEDTVRSVFSHMVLKLFCRFRKRCFTSQRYQLFVCFSTRKMKSRTNPIRLIFILNLRNAELVSYLDASN